MQEKFAQEVANGKSQSAAYRIAYPKSQTWKDSSVWELASSLMANTKVSSRVAELRKELADRAIWTREQSVKILAEIAATADKNTDRVAAIKEINAMHGFNAPQKVEHNGDMVIRWATK
jgi:hypothetical protein